MTLDRYIDSLNRYFRRIRRRRHSHETTDIPVAMIIAGTILDAPLSPRELAAYDAPFPDASYKMGPRAMPTRVANLNRCDVQRAIE